MKTEGATNLAAGITFGFNAFKPVSLPEQVVNAPQEFALHLHLFTDGLPSSNFAPKTGYPALVAGWRGWDSNPRGHIRRNLSRPHSFHHFDPLLPMTQVRVASADWDRIPCHGSLAADTARTRSRPTLTSIGLGNHLDSLLLNSFSDAFLHIPDPGSVGPFMVNLLAAARSVAKFSIDGRSLTANRVTLVIEPAANLQAVPGYSVEGVRGKRAYSETRSDSNHTANTLQA